MDGQNKICISREINTKKTFKKFQLMQTWLFTERCKDLEEILTFVVRCSEWKFATCCFHWELLFRECLNALTWGDTKSYWYLNENISWDFLKSLRLADPCVAHIACLDKPFLLFSYMMTSRWVNYSVVWIHSVISSLIFLRQVLALMTRLVSVN